MIPACPSLMCSRVISKGLTLQKFVYVCEESSDEAFVVWFFQIQGGGGAGGGWKDEYV